MKCKWIFLSFLFLLLFFIPKKSLAQTPPPNQFHDVVINEIMWMGSEKSTADEWLELYNNSDRNIDLTNWTIKFAGTSRSDYKIKSGIINSKSYFLISNYDIGEKSILNIKPDIVDTKISLSNDFGFYQLYDQNQNSIDEIGKTNESPFSGINITSDPPKRASMERNSSISDGTIKENWHLSNLKTNIISESSFATPFAENSSIPPPPKIYTNQVIFVKIQPNPIGTDSKNEWLEIKNISPDEIDINGWKIKDKSTGTKTLSGFIKPNEVLRISELSFINNSDEELFLYDENANLINSILILENQPEGSIYYLENGKWFWDIPKNSNPNLSYKKYSIFEIKKLQPKTNIIAEGVVIASPKNFSEHYFYIQDNSGGIKLYCFEKPNLQVNDIILVYGYVSILYNQKTIKFHQKDLIFLGRKDHYIILTNLSSQNLINNQNNVVKIKGKIIKEKSTYYLIDKFGKIKIYFSSSAKIKKPTGFTNSYSEITGIVDYYKNGFRFMPRNSNDIKIIISGSIKSRASPSKSSKIVLGVATNIIKQKIGFADFKDYRNKDFKLQYLPNSNYSIIKIISIILIFIGFFGLIILYQSLIFLEHHDNKFRK